MLEHKKDKSLPQELQPWFLLVAIAGTQQTKTHTRDRDWFKKTTLNKSLQMVRLSMEVF